MIGPVVQGGSRRIYFKQFPPRVGDFSRTLLTRIPTHFPWIVFSVNCYRITRIPASRTVYRFPWEFELAVWIRALLIRYRAAALIVHKCPELLNVVKEDGFSALHLAALNGHHNVVQCLIEVDIFNYFWPLQCIGGKEDFDFELWLVIFPINWVSRMPLFCIATLCDWLKNLAPLY